MIFDFIKIISEWFYPAFFILSVLIIIIYNIAESIRDNKQKSI